MTEVFIPGARGFIRSCEPRQLWAFRRVTIWSSRGGNVSMMYALVAPVLVFGAGAAIDYGRAAQIHTKLNAAADAAALAALTPAMLSKPRRSPRPPPYRCSTA
jgi:Flp pilus assembly protein TadG